MATWYVIRKGKEHGPYAERQLRSFAKTGKLKPHYRLRRANEQETFAASDLHDLLPVRAAPTWTKRVHMAVRRISPTIATGGMLATLGLAIPAVRLLELQPPAATAVVDPDVRFAYNFSADERSIPPGAAAETRDLPVGDEVEPDLRGHVETAAGYVLPSGVFKRHGGWTIWWDPEKTSEAVVGAAWHGRRHGQVLGFSKAGHRVREETWVYGVRHGVWKSWDETGRCRSVTRYYHGELDDLAVSWHANGQLQAETRWRDGRRHGLARTWLEDGTVESEQEYADGVPSSSPTVAPLRSASSASRAGVPLSREASSDHRQPQATESHRMGR